uniref:Uncharacterized protein n=1 Tax=Anguilla anguilla TaxID=7936 RepID=A0A0E9WJZ4_ANGAN
MLILLYVSHCRTAKYSTADGFCKLSRIDLEKLLTYISKCPLPVIFIACITNIYCMFLN